MYANLIELVKLYVNIDKSLICINYANVAWLFLLLTCFAVDASASSWTITGAAGRRVIAGARRETERDAVSALLRVAQTGELVVDVAAAEVALAVPQERAR